MSDFIESKLGLLLIDKLLLGLLLLIFGLWANRALERFKSQQSFHSEINKQRVAKIGLVWEAISGLETRVLHIPWRIGVILWQEIKKTNMPGLPPLEPSNSDELVALINLAKQHPEHPISAHLADRIEAEVRPLILEINDKSTDTSLTISGNRFWLGDELHTKYRQHYHAVMRVLGQWDLLDEKNELKHALAKLDASREDISSALSKVLT